jgi:hypothetical protein
VDSYIVRIYPRDARDGQPIRGLVERVGNGGRLAFSSSEELWTFLRLAPRQRVPKAKPVTRWRRE